jgi:hypothetical protein
LSSCPANLPSWCSRASPLQLALRAHSRRSRSCGVRRKHGWHCLWAGSRDRPSSAGSGDSSCDDICCSGGVSGQQCAAWLGQGVCSGFHPCSSRFALTAAVVATASGGSIGGTVCGRAAVCGLVLRTAAAAAAAVGLATAVGCRGSRAPPGWGRRCARASPLRHALHAQAIAMASGGSIGGIVCGRASMRSLVGAEGVLGRRPCVTGYALKLQPRSIRRI